jgi:glycosyltransferase involved in cell wall biosynthesis
MIRADIVDPSAYTPPYDHALCAALAAEGAGVRLITSDFAYGSVPAAEGYEVRREFYRHALGAPGSRARLAAKLAEHVPDMLRYRRLAQSADLVHLQWLTVPVFDRFLLPRRPIVLTAHDLLPREPRPGQVHAQRRLYDAVDAIVVHSSYGRERLLSQALERPLPPELAAVAGPVVLFFGLLRPYKGVEVLLQAWRGITGAELWIVGRPRMDLTALRAAAPPGVRFVPRFVPDDELPAFFRRADVLALPYTATERFDQSGVLATALAFGRAAVVSDVGGFGEVAGAGAASLVPPADATALHDALVRLLGDPAEREQLAAAARAAAEGQYSWQAAARATLRLYATILR